MDNCIILQTDDYCLNVVMLDHTCKLEFFNLRKYSLLSDIPKCQQVMFEVPLLKRGDSEAHESCNNKSTVL